MRIDSVRKCLRILANSVLRFEQEDSSSKIKKAEEDYKKLLLDESSKDKDIEKAYEQFDRASGKWFAFHSAIEKMEDAFYSVFIEIVNGERKLDYKLLEKVMRRLPSEEAKYLLILAIKHYSLSRKSIESLERIINQDEERQLKTNLQKGFALAPKTRTNSKASLSQFYKGKEENTFKEMKKVSHMLDIKTLKPLVS